MRNGARTKVPLETAPLPRARGKLGGMQNVSCTIQEIKHPIWHCGFAYEQIIQWDAPVNFVSHPGTSLAQLNVVSHPAIAHAQLNVL